jgi:hypothetical protein
MRVGAARKTRCCPARLENSVRVDAQLFSVCYDVGPSFSSSKQHAASKYSSTEPALQIRSFVFVRKPRRVNALEVLFASFCTICIFAQHPGLWNSSAGTLRKGTYCAKLC